MFAVAFDQGRQQEFREFAETIVIPKEQADSIDRLAVPVLGENPGEVIAALTQSYIRRRV